MACDQPEKRREQLVSLLALTTVLRLDKIIAGIALAHGARLVTHNLREFGRVRGLEVVDWY